MTSIWILGILDDQDVEWMMRQGHKVTLEPGEHLLRQGTPADSLYFVLDGCFVVYTSTAARVAELKAGEVVGEISFIDSRPPLATVTALDNARVLAVPRAGLQQKLDADKKSQKNRERMHEVEYENTRDAMYRLELDQEGRLVGTPRRSSLRPGSSSSSFRRSRSPSGPSPRPPSPCATSTSRRSVWRWPAASCCPTCAPWAR